MSILCYNYYCSPSDNIGDASCSPSLYFDFPFQVEGKNIDSFKYSCNPVIFGGGGLLYRNRYKKIIFALENKKDIIIGWGIGHNKVNYLFSNDSCYRYLDSFKFDLLGIRDYGIDLKNSSYVPCVSCMSSFFNKLKQITNDIVLYTHRKKKYNSLDSDINNFPIMDNSGHFKDLEKKINFIKTANVIITNSYHGAYWGMLLNKKVIVYKPWASKFFGFKIPPFFAYSKKEALEIAKNNKKYDYSGILEEYRYLNNVFYKKTIEIILNKK